MEGETLQQYLILQMPRLCSTAAPYAAYIRYAAAGAGAAAGGAVVAALLCPPELVSMCC
jgi:hypothetical protein